MHVHLIGVCGMGMGSLAGLLKRAGHRVTGSDRAFHPPMGDALARWGIECKQGFDPAHLDPRPDLVVVGNVCRPDNPEARAAIDGGMTYTSLPGALRSMFLEQRRAFVVAGTHGKTTTTALLTFLLHATGEQPGFLIGGIPRDFDESFGSGRAGGPFVIEGDEYDSAFFEKSPKFWQYAPQVALIHAIEHDHIDIYPDMASYVAAFERFVTLLPPDGLLLRPEHDDRVADVARHASCRVATFGSSEAADVRAEPLSEDNDGQCFRLSIEGEVIGEGRLSLGGAHNLSNALGALGMAHLGAGVEALPLLRALGRFRGVARRQELRGEARGVRIYDDFAHHPTAVAATLGALRRRHPKGRLLAIFEPRSATASRRIHQAAYGTAFDDADEALIAQVGRPEIAAEERLDVGEVAAAVRARGTPADAYPDTAAIVERVAKQAHRGDTVVIMSNGAFDGIHEQLLTRLAAPEEP